MSVSNGCGGQCTRPTEGIGCGTSSACASGQCTAYTLNVYYSGTTTSFDPTQVITGETITLKPQVSPSRTDIHYTVSGYGLNYPDTQLIQFTPGPIGQQGSISVTATTNAGAILTTKVLTFTVGCLPGHACYCPTSKYCLVTSSSVVAATGYCPTGKTCGTCNSATVIDQTDPANLKCVTKPATCTSTNCLPIVEEQPLQYRIIDCHNVTVHTVKTTAQSCTDPYTCTPQANAQTTEVLGTSTAENRTVADNTECSVNGIGGFCQSGTCVKPECLSNTQCTDFCRPTCNANHVCVASALTLAGNVCNSPQGLTLIEGNRSLCNTGQITICGASCDLSPAEDHVCSAKVNGICKGSACTQECPQSMQPGCQASAGQYFVKQPFACKGSNSCYGCIDGTIFKEGKCVPTKYRMEFEVPTGITGEDFTITPRIYDSASTTPLENKNNEFRFEMKLGAADPLYSTTTFTTHVDAPGSYSITITATALTGDVAGATRTMTVVCGKDVACCSEGSNAYNPDGSACSIDGIPGTCSNHQCELKCKPSGEERGSTCNNGQDDDCDGYTDCYDSACTSTCGDLRCPIGNIICSSACVDQQKDNANCGSCGNRCGMNEQCTQGTCKAVENCQIVCNADRDCGKGTICINPGDCTKSFCAPAGIIVQNTTQANEITRDIINEKSFTITTELRGKELRIGIKNLAPVALPNFTLVVNVPKEIAKTSSDLAADQTFTVVQDDPVIAFNFAQVSARQDILIELPVAVDPAYANSIRITGTHDNITELPAYLDEDDLTITRNIVREGGKTTLLLGIDPHSQLKGVRVPVQIPKCIAAHASELKLQGDYDIVKDDPLVVWTFDALSSKQTIEIGIDKDISESCKNDLTAFAVADNIDRPINPWIPLLIIPLLGVIIIFFQRFHAGEAQEHMSKNEFIALAKQEGASDEQAEREWKEYEQKF
jgi:hypothetical protein